MPSPQRRILVVAALSYELEKLESAAHPGLVLLETGEGTANAASQLETWFERDRARAVLSIGFAGALSSCLQVGDLVVARDVRESNTKPDANLLSAAEQLRLNMPFHFGLAITSNQILWQAKSKQELSRSLLENEVGFVDMESTAVANVCAKRGVPFLIARSITDLLDEDLPLDFNLCRNSDGRVDQKRVMKAALLKPAAVKGLLELRKRSRVCSERMAAFVERFVPLIP